MAVVCLPAEIVPQHDADESDETEKRAEGEAGDDLLPEHIRPAAERKLAKCQGPDDDGRRLRSGVAPGADNQRDKQRYDSGLFDLRFKMAHGGSGERLADEQSREPSAALS